MSLNARLSSREVARAEMDRMPQVRAFARKTYEALRTEYLAAADEKIESLLSEQLVVARTSQHDVDALASVERVVAISSQREGLERLQQRQGI